MTDDSGQYTDDTERCEWCNTPLWDHETACGMCQSCRQDKREMSRSRRTDTNRSGDSDA